MKEQITPEQEKAVNDYAFEIFPPSPMSVTTVHPRKSMIMAMYEVISNPSRYGLSTPGDNPIQGKNPLMAKKEEAVTVDQLQKEAEAAFPFPAHAQRALDTEDANKIVYYQTIIKSVLNKREGYLAAARKHSVTRVSEQQVSKYLIMDVAAYFNDQWGIEMNEDEVIRVGKMYASHSVTPVMSEQEIKEVRDNIANLKFATSRHEVDAVLGKYDELIAALTAHSKQKM